MGTTNRAEELANKHYDENQGYSDSVKISKNEHIQLFIQGYNSRQSEIDELTKEVERLRKGIDWTRAEYIKCVNDSDEITEKLEELLTTH